MESRTFTLLEFPKVLTALAALAASEPGKAACLASRPLADVAELALAQRRLAEAMDARRETRFNLAEFPDIDGLFAYLDSEHRVLDLDGLHALKIVLDQARTLGELFGPEKAAAAETPAGPRGHWPTLSADAHHPERPRTIHAALKRCLGQDGRLRDESSPELFSARQEIRAIHQQCAKRVKDFVTERDLGPMLRDDYMTISSDRYVLPLKANFKGRVPGIIHDYSQTGETCYFEPFFLVEVNNRLQELKKEEREAERKVMEQLTAFARQDAPAIRATFDMLTAFDCLLAKAALAEELGATLPDVGPGRTVELLEARHPLLLRSALIEGSPAPVPQDLILGADQKALVVSGANAGGKTVCLKTLGLLALMALSGMAIPAGEGSRLPFWRKIYVFMGDEQSLEDHVSTFTAQIRHLSRVWEGVDADTLVLLDEFGAGTDPAQGAALAQAVVDGLLARHAWAALATHFPALKAFALSREGVRAAGMLFDPASRKPLFKLVYDQVGASNALEVAREHGLPEELLERAGSYLLMDGGETGRVFDRLNELALARERELEALRAERRREREKTAALAEKFRTAQTALVEELRQASRDVLRRHEEGRLGRKQAQAALADARKRLIEEGNLLAGEAPDAPPKPKAPDFSAVGPGDTVFVASFAKNGQVLEKDEKRRSLKVDIGGVRLWIKAEDAGPAETSARPAKGGSWSLREVPDAPAGPSLVLDLRGMRADAAVAELAAFLDTALLRGARDLEIVHGKGTGALRREVHEYLRASPVVRVFALAPEDRGGDGMTMVEMK